MYRLLKGFLILYLLALPFSTLLVLFVGIMGGAAPGADPVQAFLIVGAMFYLGPIALFLAHVMVAKVTDLVLRLVPLLRGDITGIGLAVSALVLVVAGNVFVDDLYQWRQGNFGLSVVALIMDLAALAILAAAGLIPIPPLDRLVRRDGSAAAG